MSSSFTTGILLVALSPVFYKMAPPRAKHPNSHNLPSLFPYTKMDHSLSSTRSPFTLQNMIKVRYSVIQMILILNYLFIASSTAENESELRRVITMEENEWEAGFVPGQFDHMQVERWWMKTRNFLTQAGSLRAFSVEDLKCHLGYILLMLSKTSLQSTYSRFIPRRRQNPSRRPFGSRASIALICYSFSGIANISDYQSVDPWLFDIGFVNNIFRRLQRSPLFDNDIQLDELKIVLINLEAILSIEDEWSALIQPHPIDIKDTIQI